MSSAGMNSGEESSSAGMNSGEESSSAGRGRKPWKPRDIKSELTPLTLEKKKELTVGLFKLNKPSGKHNAPTSEVYLDITDKFSIQIMHTVNHPNVLRLETVVGTRSSHDVVCVEKYTSTFHEYLCSVRLPNDHFHLQQSIRQMIEAVNEIRLNGFYHGNMNIYSAYYDRSAMLLKVANFKERVDMDVNDAQYEDWKDIGNTIDQISELLKKKFVGVSFVVMEDLGHQLKILQSLEPYDDIKTMALDHVFFWNKVKRTSFFIHGIIPALYSDKFKKEVEDLDSIPLDWHQHGGTLGSILATMNQRRVANGESQFSTTRYSYVLFVSACYTHQNEPPLSDMIPHVDVDKVFTEATPGLCLDLVRIV